MDTAPKASDPTIDSLKAKADLLETQLGVTTARLKESWMYPKIAAIVLAILVIVPQFLTIIDIFGRSREVRDLVKTSQESVKRQEDTLRKTLTDYEAQFRQNVKTFNVTNERTLKEAIDTLNDRFNSSMTEVEMAQQCLSLVSMGHEQAFLRHNPTRALIYVNSAKDIFNSRPSRSGDNKETSILSAIYPSIWNLQCDCLLQLSEYEELNKLSSEIIGSHTSTCLDEAKHCTLRSAFYYKALTLIPAFTRLSEGMPAHNAESKLLDERRRKGEELLAALNNGIGSESGTASDVSVGVIYKALLLTATGRYAESNESLEYVLNSPARDTRLSPERAVVSSLAKTTREINDFITSKNSADVVVKCDLDSAALTSWDAELLEFLVRDLISQRQSLVHSRLNTTTASQDTTTQRANSLGRFCVKWIIALRAACGSRVQQDAGCENCSGGDVVQDGCAVPQNEAVLYSEYGITDIGGSVPYSRDPGLGRLIDGKRVMKSFPRMAKAPEVPTTSADGGNVVYTNIGSTPCEPRLRYTVFNDMEVIPAAPYSPITDEDLPGIYELLRERRASDSPMPVPPQRASPSPR